MFTKMLRVWKSVVIPGELCGPHDGTATALAQASLFRMYRDGLPDTRPGSSSSDGDSRVHGCFQGEWPGKQLALQSLWRTVSFQSERDTPTPTPRTCQRAQHHGLVSWRKL